MLDLEFNCVVTRPAVRVTPWITSQPLPALTWLNLSWQYDAEKKYVILLMCMFSRNQMRLVIAHQLKKFRPIGLLLATYTYMTIGNSRQCLICLHNQHWTGVFQLPAPWCVFGGCRWPTLMSNVRSALFLRSMMRWGRPASFVLSLKSTWKRSDRCRILFHPSPFRQHCRAAVVCIHIMLWIGVCSVFTYYVVIVPVNFANLWMTVNKQCEKRRNLLY